MYRTSVRNVFSDRSTFRRPVIRRVRPTDTPNLSRGPSSDLLNRAWKRPDKTQENARNGRKLVTPWTRWQRPWSGPVCESQYSLVDVPVLLPEIIATNIV